MSQSEEPSLQKEFDLVGDLYNDEIKLMILIFDRKLHHLVVKPPQLNYNKGYDL
jgi:hypothetical protein